MSRYAQNVGAVARDGCRYGSTARMLGHSGARLRAVSASRYGSGRSSSVPRRVMANSGDAGRGIRQRGVEPVLRGPAGRRQSSAS